ncbi:helix-turn-helix domain-containing protein [Arthrobacter sp. OAP107]|uniref:helix-turn-helix domain-containing protein n=1 Tax=Arthrobacter sp. OAP107 TaxID=3156445 RepID=UPI00339AC058
MGLRWQVSRGTAACESSCRARSCFIVDTRGYPISIRAPYRKYPERLTPQHLEEIFGLSRNTVYRWLQTGVIPAYQVEKTWVWENRNTLRRGQAPEVIEDQPQSEDAEQV